MPRSRPSRRRQPFPARWLRRLLQPAVALAVVAALGGGRDLLERLSPDGLSGEPPTGAVAPLSAHFALCGSPPHSDCVIDGDTFYAGSTAIRIADIDTPETHPPRCDREAALGDRATTRLNALLNDGPFELRAWDDRDEDRYGRKLRVVMRGGRSLGDLLVAEGLARTWTGRREPWC